MLLAPQTGPERRALRRRREAGLLIEPYPNLFARASYWNPLPPHHKTLHAMRGLQQLHPSWTFCCQSAAAAYGLPVASWHLKQLHLALPRHTARQPREGISYHRLGQWEVTSAAGVRATTLEQTVLDCACTLPRCDALAIADAALRLYDIDRERLERHALAVGRGRRGIAGARTVLHLATGASESWGESYARGMMYGLGFASPELQVEFALPPHLGGTRRVDFLWRLPDGGIVIGEFDGKGKYQADGAVDLDAFYRERQRESRLSITGARIVRFGFDDLRDPERFERLLLAYGVPRAASAPMPGW